MGAGDDQDGDGADDGVVDVAEPPPGEEGDQAGGGGDVEEQGGEAVGQDLGPAAARLGFGHQALDAGQGGVVTHGVDPHPDGRVGRHGAGHHLVAHRLGYRAGLAGDHRLVQLGLAVDDLPVGGDPGPGPDEHDVAGRQIGDRDRLDLAVVTDAFGVVGQQLGQRREGALGLADGLHLLPVTQQHDGDQGGELPPEVEVEPVEAGGHRRDVGHGDGHGDEQHHPGLAVTHLAARRRRGTASRPRRTRWSRAPGRAFSSRRSRGCSRTSP